MSVEALEGNKWYIQNKRELEIRVKRTVTGSKNPLTSLNTLEKPQGALIMSSWSSK